MARKSPRVGGYRHFVFVDDKDHAQVAAAVVEPLVGKAARQRPVAHHRHRPMATVGHGVGLGHADGGRDRRGTVPRAEGIVLAFGALGKAREPAGRAQGVKLFRAARKQFVHVTLMPHVEDEMILGRVEHPMQRKRQFHHAEIGSEVPAVFAHAKNEIVPDFGSEGGQLLIGEALDVLRRADAREQRPSRKIFQRPHPLAVLRSQTTCYILSIL